jgi:AraC-like DNA-binding protein
MAARAIQLMRERYAEPLTREELSRAAHASPWHFSRAFAKATGTSPSEFLANVRIQAAKRMLRTTNLRVTDVCLRVGYNSLGSFCRQFHKLEGVSPLRFRRAGEGMIADTTRRRVVTPSGGFLGATR